MEEEMIEQDLYNEEARDFMVEDDEINAEEAAFMKGY